MTGPLHGARQAAGKPIWPLAVGVSMSIGGMFDRIILSRPAVEAGEKLGYLPASMKDNGRSYIAAALLMRLNDFS